MHLLNPGRGLGLKSKLGGFMKGLVVFLAIFIGAMNTEPLAAAFSYVYLPNPLNGAPNPTDGGMLKLDEHHSIKFGPDEIERRAGVVKDIFLLAGVTSGSPILDTIHLKGDFYPGGVEYDGLYHTNQGWYVLCARGGGLMGFPGVLIYVSKDLSHLKRVIFPEVGMQDVGIDSKGYARLGIGAPDNELMDKYYDLQGAIAKYDKTRTLKECEPEFKKYGIASASLDALERQSYQIPHDELVRLYEILQVADGDSPRLEADIAALPESQGGPVPKPTPWSRSSIQGTHP